MGARVTHSSQTLREALLPNGTAQKLEIKIERLKNTRELKPLRWSRASRVKARAGGCCRAPVLTVGVHVLAELSLGLAVGAVAGLVGQPRGHRGRRHHGLEAALALLHVELGVEDDDVNLGHVEHPQRHRRAQVHGDGERGGLDVELRDNRDRLHTTGREAAALQT